MKNHSDDPVDKWPEDVQEAYKTLKIPSVYDSVLATEKLAVEVHKQNQDIKKMHELLMLVDAGVGILLDEAIGDFEENDELEDNSDEFSDFDEGEYDGDESDELKLLEFSKKEHKLSKRTNDPEYENSLDELEHIFYTMNFAIMDAASSIIDLSKSTQHLTAQLSDLLAKKKMIYPKDSLIEDQVVEQFVNLITEKVDATRYQLMGKLQELGVEVINPLAGDPFEEDKHVVIEKIGGGPSNTIVRTINVGYLQQDEVLRPAEVVIYF